MDPVTRYQWALGELAMAAVGLFDPSTLARMLPELEKWAAAGEVSPPRLRVVRPVESPGDPLVP